MQLPSEYAAAARAWNAAGNSVCRSVPQQPPHLDDEFVQLFTPWQSCQLHYQTQTLPDIAPCCCRLCTEYIINMAGSDNMSEDELRAVMAQVSARISLWASISR